MTLTAAGATPRPPDPGRLPMQRTLRQNRFRAFAACALCACAALPALVAAGCNYVTPALWIAQGPPKKPAEFTLPKDKKTVVFVDDRKNAVSRMQLRSQLADDVGQTLKSQGLVDNMVSGRELYRLRAPQRDELEARLHRRPGERRRRRCGHLHRDGGVRAHPGRRHAQAHGHRARQGGRCQGEGAALFPLRAGRRRL